MKQSEAVYKAVTSVFEEADIHFEKGMKAAPLLTKEHRSQIQNILVEGLSNGSVDFSEKAKVKYDTPKKISGYVPGLINNWLRKNPDLNGGVKYEAANPGIRTGSSDPEIKNMKLLIKSNKLTAEQIPKVEAEIAKRQAVLKAEKAKNVEIDYTAIPEDLLESLGIEA